MRALTTPRPPRTMHVGRMFLLLAFLSNLLEGMPRRLHLRYHPRYIRRRAGNRRRPLQWLRGLRIRMPVGQVHRLRRIEPPWRERRSLERMSAMDGKTAPGETATQRSAFRYGRRHCALTLFGASATDAFCDFSIYTRMHVRGGVPLTRLTHVDCGYLYQANTARRLLMFLPMVAAKSLARNVCLRISTL